MTSRERIETRKQRRFDIDSLRELAGEKAFARGTAYHAEGQVTLLSVEPERVLANVAGTETYRTELTGSGEDIDGECSCPAFSDWGFCKHMVAVALAANDAAGDSPGAGALPRIRTYLREKDVDALVEMIVEMAERDAALFSRLDRAAAMAHADDGTLTERLREAIDAATETRGYIGYREAAGWAGEVESVLDAVAELARTPRAAMALELAERAIDQIMDAIEEIDDSDGECHALLERAREIHLTAASVARPDPAAFARDLFERETAEDYGIFAGAAELYADVLGDEGLAEYRRLAAAAWEKLPPRSPGRRSQEQPTGDYHTLSRILDFFAAGESDVEERIALRKKDLSGAGDYVALAQFCRDQGRAEQALRHAEEGLWLFDDGRPDQRLVLLAVELLLETGRKDAAEARLWRAFEKAPNLDLYTRLRELGGNAAHERAVALLEARLGKKTPTLWRHPADLLVDVLIREKMFDDAWAAVRRHGASPDRKAALAAASEATHPREALSVYAEEVEVLAGGSGGTTNYEKAAKLIARMAKLRDAAEHAAYVAALKLRFGRRRNLMKLLA